MSEEDSSSSIGDNCRVDVVLYESGGTGSPSADVFDASHVHAEGIASRRHLLSNLPALRQPVPSKLQLCETYGTSTPGV